MVFLLFFRARWAVRGWWEGNDDACYRAIALAWTGLTHGGCASDSYFPGIALVWAPAAALTRLTSAHAPEMGMAFWVGFQSFGLWAASAWLCYRIIRRRFAIEERWVWVLLLNVPVLYYATARTSLPHAGEWFVALWMLDCLERQRLSFALLLGVLLTSIRFNDAPALLLVLAAALENKQWSRRQWGPLTMGLAFLVGGTLAHLLFNGYNGHPLIKQVWEVGFANVGTVALGQDWGLVWHTPLWAVVAVAGVRGWQHLSGVGRMGLVWMGTEFLLCATWPTNGSDFGYRYLIGSYVGALRVGMELWPHLRFVRAARALAITGALWLCLQTWVYRTHPLLTPAPIFRGYRVAHFQTRALIATTVPWIHAQAVGLSPTGTVAQLMTRHGSRPWGVRVPQLYGVRAWFFALLTVGGWLGFAICFWPRRRAIRSLREATP